MTLPLAPPVLPQLARAKAALPAGDGWAYEQKWDGFRTIAFVEDGAVFLQSRNGKPMTRYFPELVFPAGRYVVDGEVVVLDLRASRYLSLKGTAAVLWRRLSAPAAVEELAALLREQGADEAQADQDAHAFVEDLRARDLLEDA